MKDAAGEFLANKRVAVTGVSRKGQSHGANVIYQRLRFLDALCAGAIDALVDRECQPQVGGSFAQVAVLDVGLGDSVQGACLLGGRADVAGDGQRPGVLVAGLAGGRGPGR